MCGVRLWSFLPVHGLVIRPQGLADQLHPTSLVAFQNRMALDMFLAEKGGVCHIFHDQCCTFIPNNTAPDGSVTKALEGLRMLSREMHDAAGVDNLVNTWLNNVLGKWKGLVVSLVTSLVAVLDTFALVGCCCVPCICALCLKVINTAVHPDQRGQYPLLSMEDDGGDQVPHDVTLLWDVTS
ncbi:hypothetical protein NQD34_007824 [Periophthalmus magnuspinnatus]|nr:hypothetical protein NQD34_007824 [Periophthalmus magnuspinnatus]